jgi:gluconokinase
MPVLALELSTTSAKAMVFDAGSGILAKAREPLPYHFRARGTLDALEVYAALLRAGREVARGLDISAVALSLSWHTLCVCDDRFQPLTPVFTWEYDGAKNLCARMRADSSLTERLYLLTGCMPHITYPRQTLLYLIEQGFSMKERRVMSQGAYCFHRLTGEFAETVNIQSGGGFINLERLGYEPFVLDMLGIDEGQHMGRLVGFRMTAPLLADAAATLGVAAGIPVIPAHADGALNQLSAAGGNKAHMSLSVGTSGALRMAAEVPKRSPMREIWAYYGVDTHLSGAAVAGACNCTDWFKTEFLGNRMSFEQLEDEGSLPRPEPPVFLPFLFGERCPGWQDKRRAGFFDIRPSHRPADFYRAVQMGILFCMLQCYQPLCSLLGEPEKILVSGGILASGKWTQMLADIFGRSLTPCADAEASLRGASLLGLFASGEIKDIRQPVGGAAQGAELAPNPNMALWYAGQYQRYLHWYQQTALLPVQKPTATSPDW